MTEQQKFEAFLRDHFGYDDWDFKSDDIGYRDSHTSTAWYAWQARASQGRSAEWQPIETAPKDELVLVAVEFDRPGDWRMKVGSLSADHGTWHVYGASWTPTHWMPLPPPPEGTP